MDVSIKGKNCVGRWYPKPDRYVIFINKIADMFDPINDVESFVAEFLATEFHELGHIYGYRSGCKSKSCKKMQCYWCFYSDIMFMWFKYGKFYQTFKSHIQGKVDEIKGSD